MNIESARNPAPGDEIVWTPAVFIAPAAYRLSGTVTATRLLIELLKIDTTNPPGAEGAAAEFLAARFSDAGLETKILSSPAGRPNLVARLPGPSDRPALVLLSHADVVAVERNRWTRDPFGGEIHDGAVWGRGALDMKGVAVMHAEAVAALAGSGRTPAREVIVLVAADEEAGGHQGTEWMLQDHAELLGFGDRHPAPEVLGEGAYGLAGVVDKPVMPIAVAEKLALWLKLTARGETGHGMRPPAEMATANLSALLARVAGYGTPRVHPVMKKQFAQLAQATGGVKSVAFKALSSGASPVAARALAGTLRSQGVLGTLLSDTISVTEIRAGYKHNVVPGEATASLDCRILPDTDPDDFIGRLEKQASGYSAEVEPARASGTGAVSRQTALYEILAAVSSEVEPGCVVVPTLCPGITDARYFRERGAQGYGWVPVTLTEDLLRTVHSHDERIPVASFERGVEAMTEVVRRAAA